ncbi:MAG: ABC transporter ATP-binding protein [Solirubrobacteraceae bacterium]
MLRVESVSAGYGDVPVLHEVGLTVSAGEVVAVLGPNGAGKTTLLNTISGLLRRTAGRVVLDGRDIGGTRASDIVAAGVVMVPEGRRLFPFLTVRENLKLGAYHRAARAQLQSTLDEVLELFPAIAGRQDQLAGSLSGGEQQMCALARGIMSRPKLLMLDEPSLGLAPAVVETVFGLIRTLAERGLTVLIVEQNVADALEMSTRAYVLEQGRIAMTGAAGELLDDPRVRESYLGI